MALDNIYLIADALTRDSLKPTGLLCSFQAQSKVLLVESAWQGRWNRWKYKIAAYPDYPERNNRQLQRIVEKAKDRGIPTVFWNKEDSVHFDRFIDSANYREKSVKNYAKRGFSINEQNWYELKNIINVDLVDFYKENKFKENYVIYLQNDNDWHVEKHCTPFFEGLKRNGGVNLKTGYREGNIYLIMENWGNGHVPPSGEWLSNFFEKVLTTQKSWGDFFSSNDIDEILFRG